MANNEVNNSLEGDIEGRSPLDKLFASCDGDPRGSVHRVWGISMICILIYIVISITELMSLHKNGGSKALILATLWSSLLHLTVALLGTFILKRFPTSFSIGFFLGVLVIVANQNLILFGTFNGYAWGEPAKNQLFAIASFLLCFILGFFALLLGHFRENIMMSPVDVKGLGRKNMSGSVDADEYQSYEES